MSATVRRGAYWTVCAGGWAQFIGKVPYFGRAAGAVWAARAETAWLAGEAPDQALAASDTITPYRLEVSGDWRAATAEWTRRCPYDAAIAQLGADIAAVQSALAAFRRAQQRLAALRGRTPRPGAPTHSPTRMD